MDALTHPPTPVNEPVLTYAPGTPARAALKAELDRQHEQHVELPAVIGGRRVQGSGEAVDVVAPHEHLRVLGTLRHSTQAEAEQAIAAAATAAPGWRELDFDDRAAIFLRAADLLAGPWRQRVNAATMLGQSKSCFQAEIDAACELVDFWRFNVHFGHQILSEQPLVSPPGVWNRTDHRPLEGFVYAITPFNFTSIAGNLPTAPALMGNTVLWKPSPTQQLSASVLMELLEEAGLPPGVVNMLPGDGLAVSEVALAHRDLAGIHFTGSTPTFQKIYRTVGENLPAYRSYPRVVGETGGKDFVLAHPSADPETVRVALLRGAFEYAGQKCSAASRAYVARSVWDQIRDQLVADTDALPIGDPRDFTNFTGAVIDARAFAKHKEAIDRAWATPHLHVIAGGTYDDAEGWFVRPTIVESDDPTDQMFGTEYFGPILVVHVYADEQPGAFEETARQLESFAAYALTGAVLATDREAIAWATRELRFAAGNFYVNDKPTGAVVGQQPFGGARASGTNDKAGSADNLRRWTSPRSIKETSVPPREHRYPHQESDN